MSDPNTLSAQSSDAPGETPARLPPFLFPARSSQLRVPRQLWGKTGTGDSFLTTADREPQVM